MYHQNRISNTLRMSNLNVIILIRLVQWVITESGSHVDLLFVRVFHLSLIDSVFEYIMVLSMSHYFLLHMQFKGMSTEFYNLYTNISFVSCQNCILIYFLFIYFNYTQSCMKLQYIFHSNFTISPFELHNKRNTFSIFDKNVSTVVTTWLGQ